jgi:hypothetical protein
MEHLLGLTLASSNFCSQPPHGVPILSHESLDRASMNGPMIRWKYYGNMDGVLIQLAKATAAPAVSSESVA